MSTNLFKIRNRGALPSTVRMANLQGHRVPKAIIRVPLRSSSDQEDIFIETSVGEGQSGFVEAAAEGIPLKIEKSLEQAAAHIGPLIGLIMEKVKDIPKQPQEIVLELGVKFGAKGNILWRAVRQKQTARSKQRGVMALRSEKVVYRCLIILFS